MTTRAQRECVLQGQDTVVNTIIGHLLAQGWSGDRILKNVANKLYSPNRALVRVEFDSEGQQYWVNGEYTSMGENVLSGCFICIKETSLRADITAAMDRFLMEAESKISQSFAVRFIGNGTTAQPKPEVE